ncbi:hypothetical protein COCOBI_13-2050 [Coccomyxa sp. Obi]|nr:hypothetical protein COCOBI_13-2050 [Coccomyxa sp. Obi]
MLRRAAVCAVEAAMEGDSEGINTTLSSQEDRQATMPATRNRANSLPGTLGLPLNSTTMMRSPSMEAYTALYKSDVIAPESPFSRSSSVTAMQTFSSISSQGSRRLSPTNPMQPSRALSSSLSSPNLKGLSRDDRSLSMPSNPSGLDVINEQHPPQSAPQSVPQFKKRSSPVQASSLPDWRCMGAGVSDGWQHGGSSSTAARQNHLGKLRSRDRRRAQVEELDDLQAVLRYNIALQTRASQLERSMARKDREIAELTAELRILEGPQSAGAGDAKPERGNNSGAEGPAAADALPAGREFVRLCLQSQAARLGQLAASHDLRNADPSGTGLAAEAVKEVREAVTRGCEVAGAMLQPPQARAVLPTIALEHSASLPHQAATWHATLKALRLSEAQRLRVLEWRQDTLARVQAVQMERQRCVAQMLQLLAPEGVLLQSSAAQAFCNRLLQEGTLPLAKINLDTIDLTDSLAENLKEEQQVFVHANSVLLREILSPVQAALFMLQSWPAHCDCFGFANFVASEAVQLTRGASPECSSQPGSSTPQRDSSCGPSADEMEE